MKESSSNNGARFKTFSDEDLFIEEAKPLNNILSSFTYWPRGSHKLYTKRSLILCGVFALCYGFVIGLIAYKKLHHSLSCYQSHRRNNDFSIQDLRMNTLQRPTDQPAGEPDTIDSKNDVTNYEEALMVEEYFKKQQFDVISPISSTKVFLTFKNEKIPDALEIVVDKGDIRYRNVRNATYSYVIPHEVDEIRNFSNTVSGSPVYANFGTDDDFQYLLQQGISVRGHIVLLRLGKITIFEKITAAIKLGAQGVLLFADPQQYPKANCLRVNEEISPTTLTDIHRLDDTFDSHCTQNCGIAVQIIESITARNILRDMSAVNKSPNSWHGSLNALYSIGPGFSSPNWRLVLYSYFMNVRYVSHDVTAYLRSFHDSDRYVIVSSSRKTLRKNERRNDSTTALLAVSKYLAEARSIGWEPSRTILFCSFGLAETERYSSETWINKRANIIGQRSVAFINIDNPVLGYDYLYAEVNPLLKSLFSNVSSLVENPMNEDEQSERKKTLFDVWQQHSWFNASENFHWNSSCDVKSNETIELKGNIILSPESTKTAEELLTSLGIPTVSFNFKNWNWNDQPKLPKKSNIREYEKRAHQLWTLMIFSLADQVILPFDMVAYSTELEHCSARVEEEISSKNKSLPFHYDKFSLAIKNAIPEIRKFQNEVQSFNDDDAIKRRSVNDKLMLLGKLFVCIKHTLDFVSLQIKFDSTLPSDLRRTKTSLKQGSNCVDEIYLAIQNLPS